MIGNTNIFIAACLTILLVTIVSSRLNKIKEQDDYEPSKFYVIMNLLGVYMPIVIMIIYTVYNFTDTRSGTIYVSILYTLIFAIWALYIKYYKHIKYRFIVFIFLISLTHLAAIITARHLLYPILIATKVIVLVGIYLIHHEEWKNKIRLIVMIVLLIITFSYLELEYENGIEKSIKPLRLAREYVKDEMNDMKDYRFAVLSGQGIINATTRDDEIIIFYSEYAEYKPGVKVNTLTYKDGQITNKD